MRTLVIILALVGSYFITPDAHAAKQGIAVDYLLGWDDIQGIRLAYRPYSAQLTHIEWLGDLDIYWEVSVNHWQVGELNRHETNYAFAISPVISKQFATLANRYPLKWEFGIGVSLVEDTRFAGKDIGSHYQFEDRLGLVTEFGEHLNHAIALRYMHYSNGGLNAHNPGVDFLNISYAVYF